MTRDIETKVRKTERIIRDMFGLDDHTVFDMKSKAGFDYIASRYPANEQWAMSRSKIFWDWYRYNWYQADQTYLKALDKGEVDASIYTYLLQVRKMINRYHLNANISKHIIREQKRKHASEAP